MSAASRRLSLEAWAAPSRGTTALANHSSAMGQSPITATTPPARRFFPSPEALLQAERHLRPGARKVDSAEPRFRIGAEAADAERYDGLHVRREEEKVDGGDRDIEGDIGVELVR